MKKMSRREFLTRIPPTILGAAALAGAIGTVPGCSSDSSTPFVPERKRPNILLLMVDQMQTPPEGYRPDEGMAPGLKEIFGFRPISPDNSYAGFFPGLLRMREHAVVMRRHYTASSACVPSRTCIMTGQYSPTTGVDQTDGLFKAADDIPWLDPRGVPTIGDWFRAVGYTTHYFGKWHVSDPEAPEYLEPWGFADWKSSYPEPHGGDAYNLGVYRDVGFADNAVDFLDRKGKEKSDVPWLAVGSLVNPHDCGTLPTPWQLPEDAGVVPWTDYPPPMSIPHKGDQSLPSQLDEQYGLVVGLNPDGFPQNCSNLPRTYDESLDDKPQCQQDYALKWGLAWKAKMETYPTGGAPLNVPYPFQMQGENAVPWSLSYNQFYAYCHYLEDLQMRKILQALDANKLTDNTIVVFLSDHGEMAGAHGGMIQKWHNAYEEAIHVPMVISSPLVNADKWKMREILQPTSSIDLAPTLLALAGFDEQKVRGAMETVHGAPAVKPFVGADLSAHVRGESSGPIPGPDGAARPGVFFMTNDMITERSADPTPLTELQYRLFLGNVRSAIAEGAPLAPGTVRQPNNVRALCTGDWKIVRYVDPNGVEPDQWELYCLTSDPVEQTNLVDFRTGEVRDDVSVPGMTKEELREKNIRLRRDLAKQEATLLV